MSTSAHVAAILAALNAELATMATPRTAYEYDKAPKSGGDYVVISLHRVYGGNRRGDVLSPSMWRLTTRAVGSVTNVRVLLDRCTAALEHQRLDVLGEESTGIQFETQTDVEEDETQTGVWSALISWTYAF